MNVTRTVGLATASLGLLVVAACGGSTGSGSTGSSSAAAAPAETTAAVSADRNDADIAFVQAMIPHHSEAIDMAQLAAERAASPQVKELATAIEQAQGPEIEQMRGFLDAWGVEEDEPSSMPGMTNMPGMSGSAGATSMPGMNGSMPGMMSDEQMDQLEQASGSAFDRMFLQAMIQHHQGAIQMAEQVVADGQNAEVKALAEKIIDDQRAEIERMQQLLPTV